jgi:hypothetical protein
MVYMFEKTNDLVAIPKGVKIVGYKWAYRNKHDSKGNIKMFKTRLIAKSFMQREGIDYTETFFPMSSKDSFRIIMALVAHCDLELHQMDVKTTFLNGNLHKNVYMAQPEGFAVEGKEHMGYKLKKSLDGLKQASRQWYIEFAKVIRSLGFSGNKVDNCIYIKFKLKNLTILVLYFDDMLFASNDKNMLYETNSFLSSNFDMKDLGNASYVLGIEVHQDRTKHILGLSQKSYIDIALKRYNMHKCSATPTPIVKSDKLGTFQCPQNKYESDQMKSIPYASTIGSIMYDQVCIHPNITFLTRLPERF